MTESREEGVKVIAEHVKEITAIQRQAAGEARLQLFISGLTLAASAIGLVMVFAGFVAFWLGLLFSVVAMLGLTSLVLQTHGGKTPKTRLAERDKRMVLLLETRGVVDAMIRASGPETIPTIVDEYYNALRLVCTVLREDGPAIFDNTLWDYWQLDSAPRRAT